jgi:fibronectin-binding autotransporter adhesin
MKMHNPKTFLCAALLLAVAVTGGKLAQAQSCSVDWTGNAGDGQWSTAGNWSTHRVPGPTSDVCILTANGTSGSVDAIATPSFAVHSIQVGQGVGLAFGSETVSIATSLTSQGYLTMFETTLSATSVDMQSGSLVGGGTIEGSLTNNGYLSPTNGETLTVTGDYTQTAGAELSVNFATTYPPALVVKSNATLSGTLSVGVNLKRPPAKGSTYTAITFGSLNGEFTSFTVEGGGTVKYTSNSVVVTFQ